MNPSQRSDNPPKEPRRRELGPSIERTDLNRPTRFTSDMRFRVDLPKVNTFLYFLTPYPDRVSFEIIKDTIRFREALEI